MKVALISDIHGNVPALREVLADVERFAPDQVVVNGDVVSRGPRSDACIDLLLEAARGTSGWTFTRGNHEDYVTQHLSKPRGVGLRAEMERLSFWAFEQMGPERAALVGGWPLQAEIAGQVRATHASMGHNRRGIYREMDDDAIRPLIAPAPAVFATAHTHIPFVRRVDQTLVVNSGAVGAPFDGDVRASYARLRRDGADWSAEIVRLPYDRAAAERDFWTTGCLDESGPLTRVIFHEWKTATAMTLDWFRAYERPVLDGQISLEASVDRFLADR